MGRKVAVVWHALFSIAAGVLYFFFVLPRWPELSYATSHTLGTVLRAVTGALIGLAALPVVFTWLRTRRPEYGTPKLALTLRLWSIVFQVLGGVLIIGTAISEIWLSLDATGQWLFGIYGAAAAISILGVLAFYLAFIAELPPPPPRPITEKRRKRRRRRKGAESEESEAEAEAEAEAVEVEGTDAEGRTDDEADEKPADKPAEVTAADDKPAAGEDESSTDEGSDDEPPAAEDTVAVEAARGGLRNRRPSGKTSTSRRRRRLRGGVAVED